MSVVYNNLLLTADAGVSQYQVQRSLRFNSADTAYLNRTPSVAGNRKTWTWAAWVKRSALASSSEKSIFIVGTSLAEATYFNIAFTNDKLVCGTGAAESRRTTSVYRDLSAWYHLVVAIDTTQATAANRVKIYVNGTEVTAFDSSSSPTFNLDTAVNSTLSHNISRNTFNSSNFFDGYLADVHFIDGQALTPSSFTETNATTGQLVPKAYTGTYGTNGFRLNFSDNSAATAATLGADSSGNGNNWTPNNLSVTAGAGNDSLTDTPTSYGTDTGAGGEVRGNYCTWNPLDNMSHTLTDGNLKATGASSFTAVNATLAVLSGKWYWEVTAGSAYDTVGIWSTASRATTFPGGTANSFSYNGNGGQKYTNSSPATYGASYTTGDVVGVALNMDAQTLTFYKNGVSQGQAFSGLTGSFRPSLRAGADSLPSTGTFGNFGQRPFAYAAPSGFKALCDTNIPEGTITTSGTFTGNANADGPFVYLNGVPTAMTINSNAVTFATHADKLANGFKVRSSSGTYNTAGSNTYSITTTGAKFKYARAQPNP